MHLLALSLAALSLLPLVTTKTSAQLCNIHTSETDGNWYCLEVDKIIYRNISQSGTYNRTSNMDIPNGLCSHDPVAYSGTDLLAPLIGEVSIHLRGPMNLSQLAVYTLPSTDVKGHVHGRRSEHIHKHMGVAVFATGTSCSPGEATPSPDNSPSTYKPFVNISLEHAELASTAPSTASSPSIVSAEEATWNRVAYYASKSPAQATGFAFMANVGNPGVSGTWDTSFGSSLAYVSSDGTEVVSQPAPFNGADGWNGVNKLFLVEFQMDHYDNTNNDQGLISDAPAYWFLNSLISRTLQYGNDRRGVPCSCWITGCGEFDAFEVLARGEERAKSTLHRQGNFEGGDSNYFRRPVGRTLKFAVMWYQYNITATVLPDDFSFSQTLLSSQIDQIVAYDSNSNTHSLFAIGA
ncbi:hypothetical protein GQ43DRAFT_409475 [Delitschia confertaspora ATCC 74209]|uniref:glucan endo-1,3-beta-D-glucosidase n=1 Tax=Delitschia confertaspora ATCC 74209 TaxID=1513339 RepID=A0A9P4MSS2_9PLEO|nr:hypothetical protein GQ43DRAFT_409475 [Delitschia confertaspora ATCC 74209]